MRRTLRTKLFTSLLFFSTKSSITALGTGSTEPTPASSLKSPKVPYISNKSERRLAKQIALAPISALSTFDPGRNVDSVSQFWLGHVYEGLMTYNEKGEVVPAAAESMSVSSDGREVNVQLRAGLTWHDGRALTAKDFEYAWKRVADPKYASEYSFALQTARIRNAAAILAGQALPDTLGVVASSDRELRIQLDGPSALLPELLTLNVFFPVRKDLVEIFGDKFGTHVESVVGNGSYRISTWEPEGSTVLVKAQQYWNAEKIRLESIALPFVTTSFVTAYQAYATGGIDYVTSLDTNTSVIAQKDKKKIGSLSAGAQWYLLFNMRNNSVFSDIRLRRSVAIALDRREYISRIHALPGARAAYGVVPDYILGSTLSDRFRKEVPMPPWKPDFQKGRALAQEATRALPGSKLPPVRFVAVGNESNRTEADYFQDFLEKTLGTTIRMDILPFKVRMQRIRDAQFDIAMASWIPDYNDPLTFLEIFESNSVYNASGYRNNKFDALISRARNLPRGTDRTNVLATAEKILLREAIIVPYRQSSKVFIENPDLSGIRRRALGIDPDLRFAEWK